MPSSEYIIDPDWQRSVSELAAPTSEGWQPVSGASANFGYTWARIWLRVAVVNRTAEISDWRVFVQANFRPTLQIWSIGADGRTATLMDLRPDSPFDARPIAHPQTVAPLALAPGEAATLVLAYSAQGSSRIAISLETAESFAAFTDRANAGTYAFYGMVFVLLAVTNIAVIVLRQVLHAVYGGYVLSLFLYIAHVDGNAFRYLWPDHPGLNNMASVVAGCSVMVFGSLFAIRFLKTRRHHPVMHRVLQGLLVTVLGMTSALWALDPQLLKQILVIMISVSALIWLSAAIVAALQRYYEVRFHLFAWLACLIPATLFTARHIFAFEPEWVSLYDAVRAGLAFEAYMMGFVAIDQMRQSRERAMADSLAMAQRNLALGERLALLDQNYEQLATRARLREANVMDAVHDLRQPMQALRLSMRQRFASGAKSKDTGQIEAALSYMERLVADRLAARPAPADASVMAPTGDPPPAPDRAADAREEPGLHDVLRGVAEMFTPEATAKGLDFRLRLAAPDGQVAAYPLMRALANLVSNAIKFTSEGRVLFALRRKSCGWRVEIHDTGPGLDAAEFAQAPGRSRRLERDQAGTEGSGLGLAIVQQIAAANAWRLTNCHHRRTGASILLDIPFPVPVDR